MICQHGKCQNPVLDNRVMYPWFMKVANLDIAIDLAKAEGVEVVVHWPLCFNHSILWILDHFPDNEMNIIIDKVSNNLLLYTEAA